jgi:transposase
MKIKSLLPRRRGAKAAGSGGTDGRGLELQVHPASVQDRDGAPSVLKASRDRFPFQVLPRRWVGESFLAWINRNRRLAKDFEGSIPSTNAFLYVPCVMLLTRRLARSV